MAKTEGRSFESGGYRWIEGGVSAAADVAIRFQLGTARRPCALPDAGRLEGIAQ